MKRLSGVIRQFEQQIAAKKIDIKCAGEMAEEAKKREAKYIEELAEYELALNILTNVDKDLETK
ncbi:MAG: hypothetical protein ACK5XN_12955 [Bacteroidota bacterium]